MTEEEAKLKPCIGPAPQNTGELWNPGADGVIRFGCAGSTCLAWRWGIGNSIDGYTEHEPHPSVPKRPDVIYGGYCGLAGKP